MLVISSVLHAQEAPPTVDEALANVRANITAYRASIPNFSCDESVVSQHLDGTKVKEEMKIESSFRTTRAADHVLQENRIRKLVDGRPVQDQKASPPYNFQGGFANVLSGLNSRCNDFSFKPSGPFRADGKIVLVGISKVLSNPAIKCDGQRSETEALIDPETFQVLRLETTIQDVHLSMGTMAHLFLKMPSDHNVMKNTVTYAPTTLGDQTFWLPTVVESTLSDTTKPINLRYRASYSNYHRYTATSTIVPRPSE